MMVSMDSHDDDRATLEARLTEVAERIDRAGKRLTAGYGSDADRDGWLLWLRQLEASREDLRARLRAIDGTDDTDDARGSDDAGDAGDVSGAR